MMTRIERDTIFYNHLRVVPVARSNANHGDTRRFSTATPTPYIPSKASEQSGALPFFMGDRRKMSWVDVYG